MKGSQTVGFLLIFTGAIIVYAGWKNVPILSVLGIGTAASTASVTSTTNPDTPTGGGPKHL